MRVLGKVERMICAAERSLEVTQESIDRAELRQFGAGLAAAGDEALMLGADDLHCTETPQAVGYDSSGRRNGVSCEYRHLLGSKRLVRR